MNITLSISAAAVLCAQAAAGPEPWLFVANQAGDSILRISLDGCEVAVAYQFEPGERPRGLAAAPDGSIFASLTGGPRNVQKLTSMADGTFVAKSFTPSIGTFGPGDLDVTDASELLIAGGSTDKVWRFSLDTGEQIDTFSHWNCCAIQGVVSQGQSAFAAELFQDRVFVANLGMVPATTGELVAQTTLLSDPWGMTIGPNGRLLIGNQSRSEIQAFDPITGQYLGVAFDVAALGIAAVADVEYSPEVDRVFLSSGASIYMLDGEWQLIDTFTSPLMVQPYGLVIAPYESFCHADVDGDDVIGLSDVLIALAQWGPCTPECFADLDCSGAVDLNDVLAILAAWGPC